jgi:hypothetical protein
VEASYLLSSSDASGFFPGLLFDLEDGGNMLLQNVHCSYKLHDITVLETVLFLSRCVHVTLIGKSC